MICVFKGPYFRDSHLGDCDIRFNALLDPSQEEVRPILPKTLYEEVANPDQPDEEEPMDSSTQLLGEEEGDGGSDGDEKEEED